MDAEVASFGDESFDGRHALVHGAAGGRWQAFEHTTLLRVAAIGRSKPSDDAVRATSVQWRRDLGLLSGAEVSAWLTERGLETAQWRAYLERQSAGSPDGDPAPEGESIEALAVDLVCSGLLREIGESLVDGAAAEAALGKDAPGGDGADLAAQAAATVTARSLGLSAADLRPAADRATAFAAAQAAFAAAHVTEREIARRLADHKLEWTQVSWQHAGFATPGAAREAAFMVDVDGRPLDDPVALAAASLENQAAELGAVDSDLGRRLLAGASEQLVGPWEQDGKWHLVQVTDRQEPSLHDEDLRARAHAELMTELLAQYRAGRGVVR